MTSAFIERIDDDRYHLVSGQGLRQVSGAQLAALPAGLKPVSVIPAEDSLLRSVALRAGEQKHLARIVPYALEESLIDPVESLHFAYGRPEPARAGEDGRVSVCITAKARLNQLLAPLHALGLPVKQGLSEYFLLPWQPGQWTLMLRDDGRCLLRSADGEGYACQRANLDRLIALLAVERGLPAKLCLYCEPGTAQDPAAIAGSLPASIPVDLRQQPWWQTWLEAAGGMGAPLPDGAVNVLQGAFEPRLPWRGIWAHWRLAALLLVAAGLLDLAVRIAETARLESANDDMRSRIEQMGRRIIPEGSLVDVPLQLQRRLEALEGRGGSGFLALLSQASPVIMNNPRLQVQTLSYNESEHEILLSVITDTFSTAESLRAQLQALGLQAELTGSTSSNEGNRARLRIGG